MCPVEQERMETTTTYVAKPPKGFWGNCLVHARSFMSAPNWGLHVYAKNRNLGGWVLPIMTCSDGGVEAGGMQQSRRCRGSRDDQLAACYLWCIQQGSAHPTLSLHPILTVGGGGGGGGPIKHLHLYAMPWKTPVLIENGGVEKFFVHRRLTERRGEFVHDRKRGTAGTRSMGDDVLII